MQVISKIPGTSGTIYVTYFDHLTEISLSDYQQYKERERASRLRRFFGLLVVCCCRRDGISERPLIAQKWG